MLRGSGVRMPASKFAMVLEPYLYDDALPEVKLMSEFLLMVDLEYFGEEEGEEGTFVRASILWGGWSGTIWDTI